MVAARVSVRQKKIRPGPCGETAGVRAGKGKKPKNQVKVKVLMMLSASCE
jgi:hypothetical protein